MNFKKSFSSQKSFTSPTLKKVKGFTLIELLIVIGILAILATVVLLVINPAQLIKQTRDANRLTELNQIDKALALFESFGGTSMGLPMNVYVSIPCDSPDYINLPSLGGGYTYACSSSANFRKVNGSGWLPVNLASIQSQAGNLFSALPIDPVNIVAGGLYYTYIKGSWALSASMESERYIASNTKNDGGPSSTRYEMGNGLALNVNLGSDIVYATAPTNIVLAVGSSAPAGGVTNVAIPAAGATDTTGAVTGWVTTTADKIKFTVTDGGAAVSTITIGGATYTSGANYTIPSTSDLSIVVTTTEAGKTTGVRTFTVTVAVPVWACEDTLIDSRDSKTYTTVLINDQCWMAQNINIGTMTAGVNTQGTDCPSASEIEKYCYSDTESYCTSEGGLYQWNQAMCGLTSGGATDICPEGWHIPTHDEFTTLELSVCTSETCATDFPFDTTTIGWRGTNEGTVLKTGGTSDFDIIVAGRRTTSGLFSDRTSYGFIWLSVQSGSNAWMRYFRNVVTQTYRDNQDSKTYGYSVRCLKD